jgi:hypothetical protein
MPNQVVTYFFKDVTTGSAGWTETFYMSAGTLAGALLIAGPQGAIMNARLRLLHPDYQLSAVRVSDVAILRDSLILANAGDTGTGQWGGAGPHAGDTSEEPYDALLIRMEASSLKRRSFLMRGLPSSVITHTRQYNPDGVWTAAFNVWRTTMLANNVSQIRSQTTGTPTFPNTVTISASGYGLAITYVGAIPAGMVNGAYVKVTGIVGAAPVNHLWRISVVGALTLFLSAQRRLIYGTIAGTPIVQLVTYTYPAITSIIPLRGVKKSTGRPFDVLRGRARVRPV